MSHSSRVTAILATILALSVVAAVLLLHRIDQLRAASTLEEVLYVPSPTILKRMSLGYTGLMADVYWTRAVQYFGTKHRAKARQYQLLAPLLDITTTLDPNLTIAYRFGSIFLAQKPPEGAGQPDRAADLIERGIRANPNTWQLYYDLGFLQYIELHAPAAAARSFDRGSRVPGAHPFLKVLAAAMAQHAGEAEMARLLWTTTYQTTEDRLIRDNALKHLRALQVDQEVAHLEQIVASYRERTSHDPESLLELVRAGYLPSLPVDPAGHPYKLVGGQVEVADPDSLPFITGGLPGSKKPDLVVLDKK